MGISDSFKETNHISIIFPFNTLSLSHTSFYVLLQLDVRSWQLEWHRIVADILAKLPIRTSLAMGDVPSCPISYSGASCDVAAAADSAKKHEQTRNGKPSDFGGVVQNRWLKAVRFPARHSLRVLRVLRLPTVIDCAHYRSRTHRLHRPCRDRRIHMS